MDDASSRTLSALRLSDWGVIRASGPDAAGFLNGQLTQEMLKLDPGSARLAGYCSAKGRLLASFVAWRPEPEETLLACSADLLAPTLKRLAMFVLRARCKLGDASAEKPLWGLVGTLPGAAAALPPWGRAVLPGGDLVRLPDAAGVPRALWVGPEPPAGSVALDADEWNWLEVMSGVPRITAATAEQFVPQMINLEIVGGVNFQKGCYPGQEVVARSQYRGTLKRRGAILTGPAGLTPGAEIFHSEDPGQPAGMVVLAAARGGTQAAFAELKLAALDEGRLHAGSAEGPALDVAALPYPLPSAA